MHRALVVLSLTTLLVGPAAADDLAPPRDGRAAHVHFYIENDGTKVMPINDTDRWYTAGQGVSVSWSIDDTLPWVPFDEGFERRAGGVIVAQQIYTPRNILTNPPNPMDRPYAGYLFAGLFYHRAREVADRWQTMDHLQVDVGVVGESSLGEDAQKWIHDLFDSDDPQGWDSQLKDEPTLQLNLDKRWRYRAPLGDSSWAFDAIPQVGLAVGNVHRHARAAATLRVGFNLPDDFGPARLEDVSTAALAPQSPGRGWGVYGFVRVTGKAVEHNIFVEGSDFRSGPGVDDQPLVGELSFGLAASYRWERVSADVTWTQTYVTEEARSQDATHAYGAITLGVTCRF